MLKIITSIYFFIVLNIYHSNSAKILAVYSVPCISHQMYFRSITMELVKRGHDITAITTDPIFNGTSPKNLIEIDVHDVSYKLMKNILEMPLGDFDDLNMHLRISYECIGNVFENQLKSDNVQNILRNKTETFDILLYDGCSLAPIIFSHIYKVPAIAINSLGPLYGNYEAIGAVVNEAYYPSVQYKKSTKQIERFFQVVKYFYNQIFHKTYIEKVQSDAVKKVFGDEMSDIRDLKGNLIMLFVNIFAAWDWHRPVPMSLKYTGGLHFVLEKPIPKDIKSYLDSSTNGVIYVSFGTNVIPSKLPMDKMQMFAKVFSELPYEVLWKWDLDTIANKSKNIRIFKWLPQSDVLKHPNIKLFITQGGLQSTDEAITAGVPLIGIPMLGDQWFNTEKYERYNIGLQLDFGSITEDSFRHAIKTVIGNRSYYTNIIRHRELMNDQPVRALDQAVYWIEHVIRHGGSHLRAPAANVTWIEYFELELVVIFLSALGLCILALFLGIHFSIKCIRSGIINKTKSK